MAFDVGQWLYSEIGLEEPKARRHNFFQKLKRLAATHGLPVIRIMAKTWHDCTTNCKRSTPSRMFCRLTKLRLQEARLWDEENEFDTMTLTDILASGVFKQKAALPLFEGATPPPPRPGHHPKCQRPSCQGCE